MQLCKHQPHKIIDWIKSPKWSTNQVLINTRAVSGTTEHYLVQFSDESPKKVYGWFYLSGANIRKSPIQTNGAGKVYAVSLGLSEPFTPDNNCVHKFK